MRNQYCDFVKDKTKAEETLVKLIKISKISNCEIYQMKNEPISSNQRII